MADEAGILPAVAEIAVVFIQEESQGHVLALGDLDPGSDHQSGRFLGKDLVRFSLDRKLFFDRQLGQVRGRRPEPGRGHLGINIPLAFDDLAVGVMARSGQRQTLRRQRLLIGARSHGQGGEDFLPENFWKAFLLHVRERLLHDRQPAAGIAPDLARLGVHTDGGGIGRRLAVQDLFQIGHRLALGVPPEPVDGEPGIMTEDQPEGRFMSLGEFVVGKLPGTQGLVDVRIEGQSAFLDEPQGARDRHGLADRPGHEQRLVGHRRLGPGVHDPIALGPIDLIV